MTAAGYMRHSFTCIKPFFVNVHSSHFPSFLFLSLHHMSCHAPALGALLALAFLFQQLKRKPLSKDSLGGREMLITFSGI